MYLFRHFTQYAAHVKRSLIQGFRPLTEEQFFKVIERMKACG